MKTLYLLRHAKSSWDDQSLADFDRPLNKRGENSAPVMGQLMRERKIRPDLIICSPAKRTRQTAKLALKRAKTEAEVLFDERAYMSSKSNLCRILTELDDAVESVLLIGHNPGLDDLLGSLTGEFQHMVTAALAKISLEIKSWKELKDGKGELNWMVKPRDFLEE